MNTFAADFGKVQRLCDFRIFNLLVLDVTKVLGSQCFHFTQRTVADHRDFHDIGRIILIVEVHGLGVQLTAFFVAQGFQVSD